MNGFYDLTPCPNKCSRFNAVVQDTIVDSTIVISDVRFGYKF
jgi:hypothetical protein